jgi:O-methyltransferase involved in polyketide biosynthesis
MLSILRRLTGGRPVTIVPACGRNWSQLRLPLRLVLASGAEQRCGTGGQNSNIPVMSSEPSSFDTSVAHPARVYDYWLGGKDNYKADRDAAEQVIAMMPSILPGVRANRAFLRRAVEFLAGEMGIRQFLDVGTGLPTAQNTHEVAQGIAPESRIVYVDNDPIVLSHARALLTSSPEGATTYLEADARDTGSILAAAAEVLDFSQPIAVMILCVLQYVPDSSAPHRIVSQLMDAVPAGSYLALSDGTGDIDSERGAQATAAYNARLGQNRITPRTRQEISAYFAGLELVDPGLVPLSQWRAAISEAPMVPAYGGVGRKP